MERQEGLEAIPDPPVEPRIHSVYEQSTGTWQHIVADTNSPHAVIIDPILDHNAVGNGIGTTAADKLLNVIRDKNYTVDRILETHANSSTRSSAWYLRTQLREQRGDPARLSIGKSVANIQRLWEKKYGVQESDWFDSFDSESWDGDSFFIGGLQAYVIKFPGEPAERSGYMIGGNIFVGDETSRQSSSTEKQSSRRSYNDFCPTPASPVIQRLMNLPQNYRVYGAKGPLALPKDLDGYQPRPFATIDEYRRFLQL